MLLLAVATAALYLNRRAVAQRALVSWLAQHGVESDVHVERIERDGLTGRLRLGPQADPDVSIERIDVDYAVDLPWSSAGFGLKVARVHLQRPVVRASWRDGRLSLGSLDSLLKEFLDAPPGGDSSQPEVRIEAGELRLLTDGGALQLVGGARVEDGRLMHLAARMPATRWQQGQVTAQGLAATVDLTTTGQRVAIRLEGRADQLSQPGAQVEAVQLLLEGEVPYPDLQARRVEGPFNLKAGIDAARGAAPQGEALAVKLRAGLEGRTTGDLAAWTATAQAQVDLAVDEMKAQDYATQGIQAALPAAQVEIARRDGGLAWSLQSDATLDAGRFAFGELVLQRLQAVQLLDVRADASGGVQVLAEGSLAAGHGSWPLLGAPLADDLPELVQMKRALRAFSLRAPGVRIVAGAAGTQVSLTTAARVSPANGGALVIAPASRPVYAAAGEEPGGGALHLSAVRGRGLPEASFVVPDWHFTDAGFEARLEGRAALDFDPARGIAVETRGVLALAGEQLTYLIRDCARIHVDRIELEENDATGIAVALCPQGGPLFTAADRGWKVQAAFRDVSADVAAVAMRFADFEGQFVARSSPRGMQVDAGLSGGQAIDATAPARFNPLGVSGTMALQGERWDGAFDLTSGTRHVGRMTLVHDSTTAAGGVRIEVPELAFVEGGLQPAELSALAGEFAQSPVVGSVRFEGRIDWAGESPSTSSGRLVVPKLDFTSPAGAVKGLKGQIDFTSLTPLVTAPDQSLSVDRLVAATDVTGVNMVFALDEGSLRVAAGELHAAGGRLFAMPFAVPLDLSRPFGGTVVIETLQLGKVLADAGLAEKLTLDATVSGKLPFTWTPGQGVRIVGGNLAAVQPGRLTLKRETLAQVQASGSNQAPPGMVEDLAYQAMENLSFETLSIDVNSLDGGRVGLVFRVKGRHDPPQRQELRVGLVELITRKFMQRQLPLPSDTRIDLTLDTTLNLNQLIGDLLEVNRARQGRGEPPAAAPAP